MEIIDEIELQRHNLVTEDSNMKKIIKTLILIGWLIIINSTFAAFPRCDQNFYWTVRYNNWYHFYDEFYNHSWRNVYLNDFIVDFENPNYLDSGSPFKWNQTVYNKNFTINNWENIEILATDSTRNSPIVWRRIANHPATRSTWWNYDFWIRYNVIYDYSNNYPNTSDDTSHYECKYYQVTWCWDWVLDSADWETCDPADPSRSGWWAWWCSAVTCTPLVWWLCVPWPTVWAQGSPLTAASAWLCPAWVVVSNFASVSVWATTNYTWDCWWVSWWACSASYTTWWWGWWCIAWPTVWVQPNPLNALSAWLCPPWVTVSNFVPVTAWATTTYTWSCAWLSWGNCIASYSSWWWGWWWGWGGWWWGWWWGGGTSWINSYCWDWIVQKPNAKWQDETCDTNAPWCKGCLMAQTNPWEWWPWKITITNPWATNSYYSISSYKIVAWDKVPLFTNKDEIRFESSANLYLWWQPVSIVNNANKIITWVGKTYTLPLWSWVWRVDYLDHKVYDGSWKLVDIIYKTVNYPSNLRLFAWSDITNFRWDTSSFGSSEIYRDTNMSSIYPSQWNNVFYINVWFIEEAMSIRVTKNIISNVSWWNAYIYNPVWFDVNYVVWNYLDKLASGNFTTTSINARNREWQNLSSLTSEITSDSNFNNKINETNISDTNKITSSILIKNSSLDDVIVEGVADFDKLLPQLWDNQNIRIIKDKNLIIKAWVWDLKLFATKTIIIENWDLIINRDISYFWTDSSWAFVVKNGNILVSKDVSKISWVYLDMKWSIWSSNWATEKQLVVEWSLYWNSQHLSKNRTYVRATEWSSALTTWVIINYSNRVLKNPPPMLTNFIEEYNEKRIAK